MKEAIATEARAQRRVGHVDHRRIRYRQRSSVERVNALLKDCFGGRTVHFRGAGKVFCHLMFGILALTVGRLFHLTV